MHLPFQDVQTDTRHLEASRARGEEMEAKGQDAKYSAKVRSQSFRFYIRDDSAEASHPERNQREGGFHLLIVLVSRSYIE